MKRHRCVRTASLLGLALLATSPRAGAEPAPAGAAPAKAPEVVWKLKNKNRDGLPDNVIELRLKKGGKVLYKYRIEGGCEPNPKDAIAALHCETGEGETTLAVYFAGGALVVKRGETTLDDGKQKTTWTVEKTIPVAP